MEGRRAYLDHNATSPLRPEAAEAMLRAHVLPGNPSSVHAEGREARAAIELARRQVAALAGVSAAQVTFVASGTEAAATLLNPAFGLRGPSTAERCLIVGSMEHACVLAGGSFAADRIFRVHGTGGGWIDLASLDAALAQTDAPLVAIQHANNETGVIQPIVEIGQRVEAAGGSLMIDAVQTAGKIPLVWPDLSQCAMFLSAHKIGGPKGVGAFIVKSERVSLGRPLITGGGQERGLRAGTENVAGIAGFGAAADAAMQDMAMEAPRLEALRDRLEAALLAVYPDATVFGRKAPRLPHVLNIAIPGTKAETALIRLDLAGVACSSGSACSSGKVKRSHVLDAMGVGPDLADCALRFSLGWSTTEEDIALASAALARLAPRQGIAA
ncbi:MAG: cysteine desulfurase family protein [Beijerinckiaceae bacterium]